MGRERGRKGFASGILRYSCDVLYFNLGHFFSTFSVPSKGARRAPSAALNLLFSFKIWLNILETIENGEKKVVERTRGDIQSKRPKLSRIS